MVILLNTPVQQNVISPLGRKPLPRVFTQVPSQVLKIPISFLRPSALHVNNSNHQHEYVINLERNLESSKLNPSSARTLVCDAFNFLEVGVEEQP